jgi:hypothetical protein
MKKPFWMSKTLWFNFLAGAATYLLNHSGAFSALGLTPEWQTTIILAVNVILRCVTNAPLTTRMTKA